MDRRQVAVDDGTLENPCPPARQPPAVPSRLPTSVSHGRRRPVRPCRYAPVQVCKDPLQPFLPVRPRRHAVHPRHRAIQRAADLSRAVVVETMEHRKPKPAP